MWSATVQSDNTVWPSVAGHALPEPVLGLATVYVWDFFKVEASQVDQQLQDPTQSLQARVSRVPEAVGHDEPLPILVRVTVYVRSSWSLAQEDQAEKLPTQLRLEVEVLVLVDEEAPPPPLLPGNLRWVRRDRSSRGVGFGCALVVAVARVRTVTRSSIGVWLIGCMCPWVNVLTEVTVRFRTGLLET